MSNLKLFTHMTTFDVLQVDSFAIARDSDIHEATRRMLSVLLRQVNQSSRPKESKRMKLYMLHPVQIRFSNDTQ